MILRDILRRLREQMAEEFQFRRCRVGAIEDRAVYNRNGWHPFAQKSRRIGKQASRS